MSITVKAHVNQVQSMLDTMLAGIPKSNIIFTFAQEQVATEPQQNMKLHAVHHNPSNEELDAHEETFLVLQPKLAGMAKYMSRS